MCLYLVMSTVLLLSKTRSFCLYFRYVIVLSVSLVEFRHVNDYSVSLKKDLFVGLIFVIISTFL